MNQVQQRAADAQWDATVESISDLSHLRPPNMIALHPDGSDARYMRSQCPVQEGYFADLAQLIEEAVASNGGRPATIVAHSLGCLVSLYFLARQSRQWLQKHVSGLVAISGPWGGAVSSLKGTVHFAASSGTHHHESPRDGLVTYEIARRCLGDGRHSTLAPKCNMFTPAQAQMCSLQSSSRLGLLACGWLQTLALRLCRIHQW